MEDHRKAHWYSEENLLSFSDYDGESLTVKNHNYPWSTYDGEVIQLDYISIDYEGQGPVVMEYDEARRFIKEFTELLDKAERKE